MQLSRSVSVVKWFFFIHAFITSCCAQSLDKAIVESGRAEFDKLSAYSQLPKYGACWTDAMAQLQQQCRQLSDQVQARLALSFAACFLATAGLATPPTCRQSDLVTECVRRLDVRQFAAYQQFFTHTHNMCSFLQVQVWNEATWHTVNTLRGQAASTVQLLRRSDTLQRAMAASQRRALQTQHELLQNGRHMSLQLDAWKSGVERMVAHFRETTMQHSEVIVAVLERITSLQRLVLDKFSWLNTLAFYVCAILVAYLATSTTRAAAARMWLFVCLSVNLLLERMLADYIIRSGDALLSSAQHTEWWLHSWVYVLRRGTVCVCVAVLAMTCYQYRDVQAASYQLLQQLHEQQQQLHTQLTNIVAGLSCSAGVSAAVEVSATDWRLKHKHFPGAVSTDTIDCPVSGAVVAAGDCARVHVARAVSQNTGSLLSVSPDSTSVYECSRYNLRRTPARELTPSMSDTVQCPSVETVSETVRRPSLETMSETVRRECSTNQRRRSRRLNS